jgi:hypothetical protein
LQELLVEPPAGLGLPLELAQLDLGLSGRVRLADQRVDI